MALFGSDALFQPFEAVNEDQGVQNGATDNFSSSDEDFTSEIENYKQENMLLRAENEKLKAILRSLMGPKHIKIDDVTKDGPILQLLLFNHIVARKHHANIKMLLQNLLNPININEDLDCDCRNPKNSFNLGAEDSVPQEAFHVFSSYQVYREFYLDLLGEPINNKAVSTKNGNSEIPEYERNITGIMTNDPDEPLLTEDKKIGRICFNCGEEGHQLRDCTIPKNYQNINRRRDEFQTKFDSPMRLSNSKRYHLEEDEKIDEELKDFKPGVLSKELRSALGLSEESMPPYLYTMRRLGYPPGHLEASKVTTSGLSMYEENENSQKKNDSAIHDTEKFIAYPGFNIPPLPGQKDIHEDLGAFPFDTTQSLEAMKKYFQHKNKLRRKQCEMEEEQKSSKKRKTVVDPDDDMNVVDMDVTDEEDTGIIDVEDGELDEEGNEMKHSPPPSQTDEDDVVDVSGIELGNLSEEELQIKMEMLKRQLQETGDNTEVKNEENVVDLTMLSSPDCIEVEDESGESTTEQGGGVEKKKSADTDWRMQHQEVARKKSQDTDWRRNDEVVSNEACDTDWRSNEEAVIKIKKEEINKDEEISKTEKVSKTEETEEILKIEESSSNIATDESINIEDSSSKTNIKPHADVKIEQNNDENLTQSEDTNTVNNIGDKVAGNKNSEDQKSDSQTLPNRSKFAEGISQFDEYYTNETKSRGVYLKLKNILRK